MSTVSFPPDFLFGVATSSYQIEGAANDDGRGESIWDRFARQPGAIADRSDGSVACDHYRRWADDLDLMKWLGVDVYRFSIAWPRVLPEGRGRVEPRGLDFYDRLVDGLLARGIRPAATLYHWDLPQALQDRGGWAARATVDAFVEYTAVVVERLGDRVATWMTHNEPWCVSILGHRSGEHAPGLKDVGTSLRVAHHVLLSHGRAVPVIRALAPRAEVGIVLNLVPGEPASPSAADLEATRRFDGEFNRWFCDPLFHARYPADAVEDYRKAGVGGVLDDLIQPGDLAEIAVPTDFLGVNYYSRLVLRSNAIPESENLPRVVHLEPEQTDMGWEVKAEGLGMLLDRIHRDWGPKRIYIAENGCAYGDAPGADGRVPDVRRIYFLDSHLRAVQAAVRRGIPVAGYFLWSMLDNFEWAYGFSKRFGIFWVDYETQRRVPKDSARWYREVIARRAMDSQPFPRPAPSTAMVGGPV
jgi:beta-glucosidase